MQPMASAEEHWQPWVPAEASSGHQQLSQRRRDEASAPQPGESQWHIHHDGEDEEVLPEERIMPLQL